MNIGVVGLGYVGLPLAVAFAKEKFSVVGFDVIEKKINELKQGIDATGELSRQELTGVNIDYTTHPDKIKECSFIIVAVPTPITKAKAPDIKYVESAARIVGQNLVRGAIVVFESTVYPGVTEEVCIPILEKESGMKCGIDFKVGYSPERINPGDTDHSLDKVIKVVSGMDQESLTIIADTYSKVAKAGVHKAPNIKTAEAAKVIENIQRDLNIALMNELSLIFNRMGINTKDVLDAAYTKWNFHRYKPGLVGGHCFSKNTKLFLINGNHHKIKPIGKYIDSFTCKKKIINDSEIFYPENVKVLSFDMLKNKTSFKNITLASKRKTNELFKISSHYNYSLEVTDLHPVIIYDNGLKTTFAKNVKIGDKIVLNKSLPSRKRKLTIDILEYLSKDYFSKVRVKLKKGSLSRYRDIINASLTGKKWNYYSYDFLPLNKYLKIEKKLNLKRTDIYLCTGRGPSFRKFPCIITIDESFVRLVGYYLSEGCITKDTSLRTRFTFNRNETEYINDVKAIIKSLGLDPSVYEDKTYQATTIKVSSFFLGFLLRDILKCGTNCYNMQIPEQFFDLVKPLKEELLKGLFRGDGGVTWHNKKRKYIKSGKGFNHRNNTISISYFTSSSVLFQQVMLFLLNQNILPKLAKREGYLTISGNRDVSKVRNWFLGEKHDKINYYLKNIDKYTTYNHAKYYRNFITVNVNEIKTVPADYVYSVEVEDTHTLITSNGIVAHNCIGVDPYYLTFKAQELGYHPEVILAGRKVNDTIHLSLVDMIIKGLNAKGKVLKDSKVLILGLTFKENVKDARNSRAADIIKELKTYNIEISAHDPLLTDDQIKSLFFAKPVNMQNTDIYDCILLCTGHNQFKSISLDDLKSKMTHHPVLVDARNFFDRQEALKRGFTYLSL